MGYHFREQDSFVRIVELTPAMRKQIEATIEHLLSVLDHFDGDENLEEDGNREPWLGWPDGKHPDYIRSLTGEGDLEEDNSDEEDCGDSEPTLGAPERHPPAAGFSYMFRRAWDAGSQEHWADGLRGDHEREEENEHGGDIQLRGL